MGGPRQEWAHHLQRDSYKALVLAADMQDGGVRGRVDARTLAVGVQGVGVR